MHGACHVLTDRSSRDLPTMLRFERNTPDELRGGHMSVSWNEWLMARCPENAINAISNTQVCAQGYPVGYTAVTDQALMEQLESAPRETRVSGARKPRARVHHDDDDYPQMTKAQRFKFLEEDEDEVVNAHAMTVAQSRSARDARLAARAGASEATVAN